ncbi:RNA polymerase sigma-54 factor [bioreactor metagenome]|jgi:RNA polymerase sigma-54 factor|uniref:RNA polymerase sigma-54 factor n=1 Tax=bioreactor metagenome TaxID=1076179 RepID=A0A644Z1T2_9ZZZZ|nr:RNA polymerase factor sigma-54 [Paludibacter sp.]
MLRQTLEQKLQQKLSPAQIQVIKMLEVPTLELEERIRQELEENPALEEGREESETDNEFDDDLNDDGGNNDDMDLEEYMVDDDIPDYRLKANNTSKDDKKEDIPFSIGNTFHENLIEQLGLQQISEHERLLAEYVIGNIDEEGYLRRTVESMVDDIVFHAGVHTTDEEMMDIVSMIQEFDPPGVGATDLKECLKLQLERKIYNPTLDIALKIVEEYFEEFSKKHYDRIKKGLDIDDDMLRDAAAEIAHLNPKPGNAWGGNLLEKSMSVVVPDFILENDEGKLSVHLNNSNIPELRVSNAYNDLFQEYSEKKAEKSKGLKDAVTFAKQKIDSARWFIDAIKQRHETLLTTMQAIVEFQYDFFIEGDDVYLKPMILKDIADMTGYDISTVSRVSNSKYIQTEFGVYPVKYFFSESMTNESGEEVSTREIKKILQECIENENKKKPLNDDALAAVLKTKGYNIARRTVAKYREQLNIPVARLRKEI